MFCIVHAWVRHPAARADTDPACVVPEFSETNLILCGADLYTPHKGLSLSVVPNPSIDRHNSSGSRMTFSVSGTGAQEDIQIDSVTSTSETSLYIETSTTAWMSAGRSQVTSSSEALSSSRTSSSLAVQLKESPWVTSTTTEAESTVFHDGFCNLKKF